MSKPVLGLLVGATLGVFDGLSALVTHPEDPEVRAGIVGIIMMGIFKGLVAGVIIGLAARRLRSLPMGIVLGLVVGALLAVPVAVMVGKYYAEIVLPGGLVGLLVGFATQRFGRPPVAA